MKFLFVPYHAYLCVEAFPAVMDRMSRAGADCTWLQLYGTPFDEANRTSVERMRGSVNLLEVNLDKVSNGRRVPSVSAATANWKRIGKLLDVCAPDVVVLGSDTGGVAIRMLQEQCSKRNIPVCVLLTVPDEPISGSTKLQKRLPGFLRALLVQPRVNGLYLNSTLLVESEKARAAALASGVVADRCLVIGNPVHDCIPRNCPESKATLQQELRLPSSTRIVVHITEALGSLFGEEYEREAAQKIVNFAEKLPPDTALICKPHPRESAQFLAFLESLHCGDRLRFIRDIKKGLLISGADLLIGHYSSMLLQGMIAGTPVLSLQVKGADRAKSVFGCDEGFVVKTWEELDAFGQRYASSPVETAKALLESGRRVLDGLGIVSDGKSVERVAHVLERMASERADKARGH